MNFYEFVCLTQLCMYVLVFYSFPEKVLESRGVKTVNKRSFQLGLKFLLIHQWRAISVFVSSRHHAMHAECPGARKCKTKIIFDRIQLLIDSSKKISTNTNTLWANSWGQKVVIFFKDSLTGAVFELEKCFFLNRSEFCQKLIGTIISTVFLTK